MSKTYRWAKQSTHVGGQYRRTPRKQREPKPVTLRCVCAVCDRFALCTNETGAFVCKGGCPQ